MKQLTYTGLTCPICATQHVKDWREMVDIIQKDRIDETLADVFRCGDCGRYFAIGFELKEEE
jgi:hypothetical protein